MFKKYNKIVDLDFFDDHSEKKLMLSQFKKEIGYLELSDSYIEKLMMKTFLEFIDKKKYNSLGLSVNKKKFSKKIDNNNNV